ncbi:hypothetical protein [Kitasatospora sp. NPDC088783]|uniref:hypothetical protein n=1 Tax=Kitasatospora sp. NPDC088783 TaxID=3364077 RepID=UPI0037FA5968
MTACLLSSAAGFEPRGLPLAVTRSALALAELTTLVFTADHDLFTYEPSLPGGMRCYGAHRLSLWCIAGSGPNGMLVSRMVAIAVLVVTASGYRPRWTCVPQWFVTWSLTTGMTLPNGGDEAALVTTMLLVPVLLGDTRAWHWARPRKALAPVWAGSSYAAWCAIRCQTAIIYLSAALSKLRTPQWRDGTALYSVLVDPDYGLPLAVRSSLSPITTSGAVVGALTWSVLGVELAIAVCALSRRGARRAAGWLAVALHGGIAAAMGLFSFGLTMVALVLSLRFDDRASPSAPVTGPARSRREAPPERCPPPGREPSRPRFRIHSPACGTTADKESRCPSTSDPWIH